MNPRRIYLVVAGDLRRSRKIGQRKLIQENLKRAMQSINREFREFVVSDFRVVGSDGFLGMLADGTCLLEIYYRLFEIIDHPFYFSVGIGDLSTRVSKNIEEIDGRAFHTARDGLRGAKRMNLWVQIKGDIEKAEVWICLWNLLAARMWEWTGRQKEIVIYYRKVRGIPNAIARCAKRYGVSQRNIYKLLEKAKYWLTEYAEEVMKDLLNQFRFNLSTEPF
ncbi:MAG: SatD family protein [bacterium]